MPIYEYECPKHGRFERIKPMRECSIPLPCPTCERVSERVMSRVCIYSLNWTQTEGEGYTTKNTRWEEVAEMDKELREK